MVNLGRLSLKQLDTIEARKWLSKAAGLGNISAMQLWDQHKVMLERDDIHEIDPKIKQHLVESQRLFEVPKNHRSHAETETYPLEELQRYAQHSKVAAKLLEAKRLGIIALATLMAEGESILNNLEKMKLFARQSALSLRITEITYPSLPLTDRVFQKLLELDPNNTDAMLGRIVCSGDLVENVSSCKGVDCQRRFISEVHLHKLHY